MTTVIIGAGPYGLSIAANLRQHNIAYRIFGRTMTMWSDHMPKGMLLKSDGFATNLGGLPLTLERFCQNTARTYAHRGYRMPVEDVIAYGHAFQKQCVGTVEDRRVVSVSIRKPGFLVGLDDGEEIFANRVIVATGLMGFEHVPTISGAQPGQISHSSAHHDLSRFHGQHVVVIGGGQSAFETAALVHEQGARVTVLSRRPPIWFAPEVPWVPTLMTRLRHPSFGMGGWQTFFWSEAPKVFYRLPETFRAMKAYSTFGPAGSGWLRHRVLDVPGITLQVGTITRIDGNQLSVRDSETITADHIIAATGFKADLRKIDFLAPVISNVRWVRAGIPSLNRRFETSVPGLHVLGYLSAASWGPSMRFIYGTNFVGPYLADSLKSERIIVQVKQVAKEFA